MERVPVTLAAALLLKEGEISISDIEAIPFVEGERAALAIAARLTHRFDTYTKRRRVSAASGPGAWEDVIVLRARPPIRHTREYRPRADVTDQPSEKAAARAFDRGQFEEALRKVSRRVKPSVPDTASPGT